MNFETKDSGERAEFGNGGVRDTQKGKPRFDLLLPLNVSYPDQLLTRAAALMGRGAEKYNDRNWEQFGDEEALERAKSSALRHLMQLLNGETDEDHAAAVVFNVMVYEYVKGVLAGKWPKIEAPGSNSLAELAKKYADDYNKCMLWTGTYQDPEPPEHVVELRRIDGSPEAHPERLWRRAGGYWGWAIKSAYDEEEWTEFLEKKDGVGFQWPEADTYSFGYQFEEVPQP